MKGPRGYPSWAFRFLGLTCNTGLRRTIGLAMIDVHPVIETILEKWQSKLGDDVDAYRGHAYRVLNIALELEPFDERTRDLVAIAIAYHDLGVWACDTMDYIHASAEIAADFVV